jgi:hypothetical protein
MYALAPTQTETPFVVTQLFIMARFLVPGIVVLVEFAIARLRQQGPLWSKHGHVVAQDRHLFVPI